MESGGDVPGVCSSPPSAVSFSPPPRLHVEAEAKAASGGPPPPTPPPPPPLLEEAAVEVASGLLDGGWSAGPPAHLPSPGVEQEEEASGTRDSGGSGEETAALLPLLLDEDGAKEAALGASDGSGSPEALSAQVLTEDLREKIVRQVEYYFSDENLPTDKFLLKYVKKDREGFVPISVIASFKRMRKLVQDDAFIVAALRTSSQLVVSLDGKKVKRLHALPSTEIEDTKPRTVLVENLPADCSTESIQQIFGRIGNIRSISIRDPHTKKGSGVINKKEMMISSKVHALVEFGKIETAENAVAALNDEKNWRSGMRVELLLKRMEKFGIIPRGHRGASEKASDVHTTEAASDEPNVELPCHHAEIASQEEGKYLFGGKTVQKIRNKCRGKGSQQHSTNGHGHGRAPSGSNAEVPSKPPPGPRMPDGTRGFTMGRGKPCIPSSAQLVDV